MGFFMDTAVIMAALLVVAESNHHHGLASPATLTSGRIGNANSNAAANVGRTQLEQQQQPHAVLKRSFGSTWNPAGWNSGANNGGGAMNGWLSASALSGGGFGGVEWSGASNGGGGGGALDSWNGHRASGPSPAEVANAIAMAKQASANVLIAQQQVQAAKDNVLHQQRLATEKETHASILTQKSEAAAAIQRSEAAAAAQSVILAQQRLAAAKSMVAQQQRIAAAKETQAATALHNSAHAAAAEIQRTEQEAAHLASAHRSDSAAAQHHLSATKDVILGSLHAGNNHVPFYQPPQHNPHAAWQAAPAFTLATPYGQHGGAGAADWSPHAAYEAAIKSSAGYNVWGR